MGFAQSNSNTDDTDLQNFTNISSSHIQQNVQDNSTLPDKNIKQVLMSAPCPCNSRANYENLITNTNIQTNKFIGPYADYDVPSVPIQLHQVIDHQNTNK